MKIMVDPMAIVVETSRFSLEKDIFWTNDHMAIDGVSDLKSMDLRHQIHLLDE